MMTEKRLAAILETMNRASPPPWEWAYSQGEEPTDDPELLKMGIDALPTAPCNIQLRANGHHRFWIELTNTNITDVVFDFEFIQCAREWVPELLAEVMRLRGLLANASR